MVRKQAATGNLRPPKARDGRQMPERSEPLVDRVDKGPVDLPLRQPEKGDQSDQDKHRRNNDQFPMRLKDVLQFIHGGEHLACA